MDFDPPPNRVTGCTFLFSWEKIFLGG